MKVTVCFGPVKVIVPCGEGDLSVQELIERAVSRYKKASYKNALDHITVRWLETCEENAILDADDRVADVCDDRDKLIAVFDEKVKKRPSNNGDGTSASSVGTSSPDIFHGQLRDDDDKFRCIEPYHDSQDLDRLTNTVSSTSENREYRALLHNSYRGGDEGHGGFPPADVTQNGSRDLGAPHERAWPKLETDHRNRPSQLGRPGWTPGKSVLRAQRAQDTEEGSDHDLASGSSSAPSSPDVPSKEFTSSFQRNFNRKSLSVGHPMLHSWIDAQERMYEDKYLQRPSMDREEPAGSSLSSPRMDDGQITTEELNNKNGSGSASASESEELELDHHDIQNLGLQVRGYKTADGRELGLIVVGVAKSHQYETKESLHVADRITEINGINLRGCSNAQAEEIFTDALRSPIVKLKRNRSHSFVPNSSTRSSIGQKRVNSQVPELVAALSKEAPKPVSKEEDDSEHKEVAIEAPDMKQKARKESTEGNRIRIELIKGTDGLGFSITSRDVVTGGSSRIFVKNILNKGAAIEDGRLEIGDEIVEVNDVSVIGKQQSEVAQLLRSTQGTVYLVVQRASKEAEPSKDVEETKVVQELPETESKPNEVLALTIPLTMLGSAGLGISVKGKTSGGENSEDLGIFVKSVLKGGAAAKDGRLQQDDQLLCINDTSLVGMPNSESMETLRSAMQNAIKKGSIRIIISRGCGRTGRTNSRLNSPVPAKQEMNGKQDADTPSSSGPEHERQPSGTSLELITEKQFDKTYLQRLASPRNKSPVRNQSYFRAVDRTVNSVDGVQKVADVIQVIRKPPADEKEKTPRSVSVSSVELPSLQPTKPIFIAKRGILTDSKMSKADVTITKMSKEPAEVAVQLSTNPPPYEEAVQRQSSNSSDSKGGSDTSEKRDTQRTLNLGNLSPPGESGDLIRAASVSSQISLDSLMVGPSGMPFSRDAFGRLSMSERKGRAHLDATKSDFYNKLKKFKSMEDVSQVKYDDSMSPPLSPNSNGVTGFREGLRRSESADTILSRGHDEEEVSSFSRNVVFNSKGPVYGPRATSPPAMKTSVKLRSRSTAWNDSFRTAVDKTPVFYSQSGTTKQESKSDAVPITWTSNAQYLNEKQRKKSNGFLKGLGNIFKIGKPKKQSPPSPEIMTLGRKTKLKSKEREEALLDFPDTSRRPKSLHEDILRDIKSETIAQRDQFVAKLQQREQRLVELKRELSTVDRQPLRVTQSTQRDAESNGGNAKDIQNRDVPKAVDKPSSVGVKNANRPTKIEGGSSSNGDRNTQARSSRGPRPGVSVPAKKPDPLWNLNQEQRRLIEGRSLSSNPQLGPRIHPRQTSADLDSRISKNRIDHRQASLPRHVIKSDQNANIRVSSHSDADRTRRKSLEQQAGLVDIANVRRSNRVTDKAAMVSMSDNKGITISHTAQI